MKKITWPLLLALGMGLYSPANAKVEHILPFPQHVTAQKGNAILTFTEGQTVTITGIARNSALERFLSEFGVQASFDEAGAGGNIQVRVGAQIMWEGKEVFNHDLAEYQNEAYHLVVTASGITIEAASPVGVIRAAQTLTQMAEGWTGKSGVNLEQADIVDWPAFKLRGYMHDIGRSYMKVQELKTQIMNFSRFKVNTFHWHLTENQGFRFQVLDRPDVSGLEHISKINADTTMSRHIGQFYTQQECREIAALAKEYGVTIIPEIDIPGHSHAFTQAFGFDMQDARALPILKEILRQVADVFPKEVSPYIDFGADEVSTNANFVKSIAEEIHKLGRLAEVWNPINGVNLAQTNTDLHHMWGTRGKALVGKPNIDSRYNYTNHHDVFADLVGIYKSNIYFEPYGTKTVAGAICATWNDRRVADDDQIMKLNNIYATTIATACRAWQGGGEQYIDRRNNYDRPSDSHSNNQYGGGVVLPNSGKEYDDFKRWEDAFLFHKENSLQKVAHQIPYVKQTNVRWRITEAFPNGGDRNVKFPPEEEFERQTDHSKVLPATFNYNGKTYGSGMATGAGIYLSHTWGNGIIRGYYDSPQFGHTAYAWTYVYSDQPREVGANIEFYNYSRSESNGIPSAGNWDHMGSQIWINGNAVPAPTFNRQDNTGSGKEKLLEDANFAARKPIKVQLNAGWNQVFLKLPYLDQGTRLPKWMFTCVFTDLEGLKEVPGLIYSPSQIMNVEAELTAVKIAEMETYRDTQVKDVPGYYNNPEAVSTLNAALDEVKATLKDDLTAEQRKQQVAKLETALNAFKAALAKSAIVLPKSSTAESPIYYTIKADLRGNRVMTSKGKDAAVVGETSYLKTSCWRFTSRGDGTFDVINYDGNFLSPASGYNTAIKAVAARPDKGWKIETTGNIGRMIINCGKVELNQTSEAQHYQIYNWSNGESGQDKTDTGCQFSISLVNDINNMSMGGYISAVGDMQTGRIYTFQNQRSSKFLTVNAEGTQVAVANSVQPADQGGQWTYYESKMGFKYLYNVKSQKFMDFQNNNIALVNAPVGHGIEFKATTVAGYPVMFTLNNGGGTVHVGNGGNLMYWNGGYSNEGDNGNAYRLSYYDNANADLIKAIETAVKTHEDANPDLMVQPKVSNASESYYYTLKSNRENRMVTSKGADQTLKGETTESREAYWKFVNRTDGKGYDIINCADNTFLNTNMKATTSAPGTGWTVKYAQTEGRVIIVSGSVQLHQGNGGNYYNILNHGGGSNTTDEGCIYQLTEVAKEKWLVAPFKTSTLTNGKFSTGMHWYSVTMPSVDQRVLQLDGDNLHAKTTTPSNKSNLFAFVGDMVNGFAVYNLVAGETKTMASASENNEAVVSMKTSNNQKWLVGKNGSGFYFKCATGNNVYLNRFGGEQNTQIKIWADGNAAGNLDSRFAFTEVEVEDIKPESFISKNFGDKWVRLTFNRDGNYVAGVRGEASDGVAAACEVVDLSATDQLWCLVGTPESFKMYTKAGGEALALHVANGNNETPATLKADQTTTWKLITKGYGVFAIVPTTATGMSLNAFGGIGNDLKLHHADDGGGWWVPVLINANKPVTVNVKVLNTTYHVNTHLGEMNFSVGSSTANGLLTLDTKSKTYYMPEGAMNLSMAMNFRGYIFKGFIDSEGQTVMNYTDKEIPEGGLNLTATFEADANSNYQYLYYDPLGNGVPYRIPAITTTKDGHVLAVSDRRVCKADIGHGEVDIKVRRSAKAGAEWDGKSWTAEEMVADGKGGNQNVFNVGFGDAAMVADQTTGEVLIMAVAGKQVYSGGTLTSHNSMARIVSKNNGQTWEAPEDLTAQFMGEGSLFTNGKTMFFGSGALCQSKLVKKGTHYRVYGALLTNRAANGGNYVVYSDDFGKTWQVLGDANVSCCSGGNEPKVTELPNGDIVLSSRKGGGRYFNIYKYTDKVNYTTGEWGAAVESNQQTGGISFGGNSTNGEILPVKAMKNGQEKLLMLQSVPTGGNRSNVKIFFKEIDLAADYTPTTFAQNWTTGIQVSNKRSAYSAMTVLPNGNVAIFYEEEPGDLPIETYCMVYRELTISEITNGAYTKVMTKEENIAAANEILNKKSVGYPAVTNPAHKALQDAIAAFETSGNLTDLQNAINTYKATATGDFVMPEYGKAYRFVNLASNGTTKFYLNADATTHHASWKKTPAEATTYVCAKSSEGKYLFVNNDGKYLTWFGNRNQLGNDGFLNDYDDTRCQFIVKKMVKDGQVTANQEKLFGLVTLQGQRKDGDKLQDAYFVIKNDNGNPASDGAVDAYYTGAFSSGMFLEEVPYANTPKLNPILGNMVTIEGAHTIGTFSAPFATVVPAGVSAFYIKAEGMNPEYATLTKVEGAIPAKQGVILTSGKAEAYNVTMIPASSETPATLENNKLAHSAGAAVSLEGNFYLLGKYGDNVGFFLGNPGVLGMNKAYLPVNAAQAQGLKLVWNEATGIEGIIAGENVNAPIYDLSGRRVMQTVKGGVYIQNGKKFIVK